jgi:hypothetical protein
MVIVNFAQADHHDISPIFRPGFLHAELPDCRPHHRFADTQTAYRCDYRHRPELRRDRLFSGDTLMINACGRTDFQQGSSTQLYHSITQKLFVLPDETLVYPAHDYKSRRVSSIGEEKVLNTRITGKSLEEFVQIMDNLNLSTPKRIHEAVPANLLGGIKN